MSEPFLAEIRIVSFNFPPRGWATCDGQLLPISQNQAVFSLLGTTYGGNGQTTFALPNLRGRTPIHFNGVHPLGQSSGEENHTLTVSECPAHTHTTGAVATTADADLKDPAGARPAVSVIEMYAKPGTVASMALEVATNQAGGSQAHWNMQPYLTLNFVIALTGIYPSRT